MRGSQNLILMSFFSSLKSFYLLHVANACLDAWWLAFYEQGKHVRRQLLLACLQCCFLVDHYKKRIVRFAEMLSKQSYVSCRIGDSTINHIQKMKFSSNLLGKLRFSLYLWNPGSLWQYNDRNVAVIVTQQWWKLLFLWLNVNIWHKNANFHIIYADS